MLATFWIFGGPGLILGLALGAATRPRTIAIGVALVIAALSMWVLTTWAKCGRGDCAEDQRLITLVVAGCNGGLFLIGALAGRVWRTHGSGRM